MVPYSISKGKLVKRCRYLLGKNIMFLVCNTNRLFSSNTNTLSPGKQRLAYFLTYGSIRSLLYPARAPQVRFDRL